MANTQRNAEKERRWRAVLSRQASSGLSVRAFCQQERLTESAFYAWRRTIGERNGETPEAPSFVPMMVTDQGASESLIAIELVGGHVLRLPASTPAAWVAELVLGLESGAER